MRISAELLSVEPLSRPLSRMALDTAPARVRPSTAGATGGVGGAGGADGAGGAGGAGGARSGTGGHAFTGRVHRGNPFRKAADLWAPARDAHTLVIQGGAPTELSRSREIVGDRGRSWELSRLREAREGGALPNTPANSSLSSGAV